MSLMLKPRPVSLPFAPPAYHAPTAGRMAPRLFPTAAQQGDSGAPASPDSLSMGPAEAPSFPVEDATPSDAEVVPLDRQLPPADSRLLDVGKVLVAGATGGTGRAVVQQLAEQGIPVRALVRDGLRASSLLPGSDQGVEILQGSTYKFQDVVRAMAGCTAVICATGPTDRFNPLGPFEVDFRGVENLAAAAAKAGVTKFVLVSSIGADDPLFPLNLFWGVLFWKKQGELALQRSGLDYTILRPGGLKNDAAGEGGVVVGAADAFGLPPRRTPGSISRAAVAEGCVAALVEPSASCKVVEVVTEKGAARTPWAELYAQVE